jgi:prevent-host-death family protein
MLRIATSRARQDLSEIVNRVAFQGERIVLNRNGRDVAVVVSLEDLARLESLEGRLDSDAAEKVLKKMKAKRQRPIPWERVKKHSK